MQAGGSACHHALWLPHVSKKAAVASGPQIQKSHVSLSHVLIPSCSFGHQALVTCQVEKAGLKSGNSKETLNPKAPKPFPGRCFGLVSMSPCSQQRVLGAKRPSLQHCRNRAFSDPRRASRRPWSSLQRFLTSASKQLARSKADCLEAAL